MAWLSRFLESLRSVGQTFGGPLLMYGERSAIAFARSIQPALSELFAAPLEWLLLRVNTA